MARLQLPSRDLKRPNQNKILQITIIQSAFVERLDLEPPWFGAVSSLWGLVCSSAGQRQGEPLTPL